MTSPPAGPSGYITSEDGAVHADDPLVRWLGPGRPRPVAAVLLLASMLVTTVVNAGWLERSISPMPAGQLAVLAFAPLLPAALLALGVAVFVLGGSPASRVVGGLASLGSLSPLLLPFLMIDGLIAGLGPSAVPWVVAVALHLATFVALLLPSRGPHRPDGGGERAAGSQAQGSQPL